MSATVYDLQAADLFLDPHPLLHRMRREAPVWFSPQLGSWVLTRYDDVTAELLDPRLSVVEETKRIDDLPEHERGNLDPLRRIFLDWGGRSDATDHAAFLRLLKRHFTPQRVLEYRPRVQGILDDLLTVRALRRAGGFDVANEVAHPLAMSVVCALAGIPADELDMFLRDSNDISGLLEMGEPEQLYRCQKAMLELTDHLRPVVADHRRHPREDLIGVLLGPGAAALHYTDDQVISQCIMFLVVGYHTTANLLCNGLELLFDHPDQRDRLVDGGFGDLPNAFNEMMRLQGPVASVRRLALVDLELRGRRIRAGDTLVMALAAANRDPAVFAAPDVFDIARPNAHRQVGFTVGPYSCMGQALARLEGQVFYRTLFSRLPGLRPRDPVADWGAFRPLGRELRTLHVLTD
jgi:cytochrome P450